MSLEYLKSTSSSVWLLQILVLMLLCCHADAQYISLHRLDTIIIVNRNYLDMVMIIILIRWSANASVVDLNLKRRGCAAFKGGRESPFGMQGDSIFYVHFIFIHFIVVWYIWSCSLKYLFWEIKHKLWEIFWGQAPLSFIVENDHMSPFGPKVLVHKVILYFIVWISSGECPKYYISAKNSFWDTGWF